VMISKDHHDHPALITTAALTKHYNRGAADEVRAVDGVDLAVRQGEVLVLAGPSGSGKTSLLSLLGCMSRPTSGTVTVSGQVVSKLPERYLTSVRRNTFGFIFQQFNLIRELSALENIAMPLYPMEQGFSGMRARARALAERFRLKRAATTPVGKLSGGEQQRVAIARALVNDPQVIVADEPTAHLDTTLSAEVLVLLEELKGEGRTIIFATHDPMVIEHAFVDRVVEMRDGKVWAVTERGEEGSR